MIQNYLPIGVKSTQIEMNAQSSTFCAKKKKDKIRISNFFFLF